MLSKKNWLWECGEFSGHEEATSSWRRHELIALSQTFAARLQDGVHSNRRKVTVTDKRLRVHYEWGELGEVVSLWHRYELMSKPRARVQPGLVTLAMSLWTFGARLRAGVHGVAKSLFSPFLSFLIFFFTIDYFPSQVLPKKERIRLLLTDQFKNGKQLEAEIKKSIPFLLILSKGRSFFF